MNLLNSILLQAQGAENSWMSFLPIVLMIVVFYFFMIRPQMKKQKEVRTFREAVKKGDSVMTVSGIHGKVADVKESTILLEIAPGVKVTVEKSGVVADAAGMPQQR